MTSPLFRAARTRAPAEIGAAATAALLLVAAVLGSRVSLVWFLAPAILLVLLVAAASLAWPRQMLVVVVLSPILDRYLVSGLLPPAAEALAHLMSEALLLAVGLALVAQAVKRGNLRPALAHPMLPLLAVFLMAALVSAVVNGVPSTQALAGIIFTLDAVALFFLARLVGFDLRASMIAIGAVIGLLGLAAIIAVAQALLSPYILGLTALIGRFGEPFRLASFFGDPNSFAALLAAAIPFLLFGASGMKTRRQTRAALALATLLMLALWLSFSRGGWLGAIGGFGVAALLLDRRALRIGLAVGVLAFVIALLMPRNALEPSLNNMRPDLFEATFGRFGAIGEGKDLRTMFIVNAVPIVADHPLLGVGPGNYGGAAADIFNTGIYHRYGTDKLLVNPGQRTVDDFWLHLLVESGLVGFVAFLAMIASALLPIIRRARTAAWGHRVALCGIAGATLCLMVDSLSTMLLEANSVAFLFWFLLGIGSLLAAQPEAGGTLAQVRASGENPPRLASQQHT